MSDDNLLSPGHRKPCDECGSTAYVALLGGGIGGCSVCTAPDRVKEQLGATKKPWWGAGPSGLAIPATTSEVAIISGGGTGNVSLDNVALAVHLAKMDAMKSPEPKPLRLEPDPPPALQPLPKCPDCGGVVILASCDRAALAAEYVTVDNVILHRRCYEQRIRNFTFRRRIPRIDP